MKQCFIFCLVLLLGATVFGQVSLIQQPWEFNWPGQDNYATLLANDISFVFPSDLSGQTANALLTDYSGTVPTSLTATVRIDVLSGSPVFEYGYGPGNPCLYPATIRPYFALHSIDNRQNGKGHKNIDTQYWRWWANPIAIVLAEGTYTISVPYIPAAWTSVNGARGTDSQEAIDGFTYVLNHLGKVGFTLGGGCFAGHGVWTTGGDAKLTVLQYDVS